MDCTKNPNRPRKTAETKREFFCFGLRAYVNICVSLKGTQTFFYLPATFWYVFKCIYLCSIIRCAAAFLMQIIMYVRCVHVYAVLFAYAVLCGARAHTLASTKSDRCSHRLHRCFAANSRQNFIFNFVSSVRHSHSNKIIITRKCNARRVVGNCFCKMVNVQLLCCRWNHATTTTPSDGDGADDCYYNRTIGSSWELLVQF